MKYFFKYTVVLLFIPFVCIADSQLDAFTEAQINNMRKQQDSTVKNIQSSAEAERLKTSKRLKIDLKIQELRTVNSNDPNEKKQVSEEIMKLESEKKKLTY